MTRLPAPDPQKAVLTPLDTEPPEEFTRLAAPGAAAVLRFSGHWEDLAFGAAVLDEFRVP